MSLVGKQITGEKRRRTPKPAAASVSVPPAEDDADVEVIVGEQRQEQDGTIAVTGAQEPSHGPGLCGEANCAVCAPQLQLIWDHAQQHLTAIPGVVDLLDAHQFLTQEIDISKSPGLQRLMS